NFTFLSYFQNEPETGYYGWLPKEGTVEPLPNGKRLPTDFNEGVESLLETLQTLVNHYGFSLTDALRPLTTSVAAFLSLDGKGEIR
ncbi:hypothetical protein MJL81_30920, partial [Salmonella enterica subsp. enterica serovar Anatum]|nr:hypothetical protein [Salmonella enterica subsp. enterica serovar Anatum]